MKPHHALTFAALSLLLTAGTSHAALSMTAVGVYDDPDNNTNSVDRFIPGNSDLASYNTFKSNVASAFAAGMGGVGTFDTGIIGSQSGININYGTGKTLNISTSVDVNSQVSDNIVGISGANPSNNGSPNGGFLFQSGAGQFATYGFSGITGGAPGEYVSQIGFTVLSRNGGGSPTMKAFVTYSDDTTSTIFSADFNNTLSQQDTFLQFAAPEGKAIKSLTIDWGGTGDLRRGIDDLAFITVPEPSALALGALGLLPLLRRRRK